MREGVWEGLSERERRNLLLSRAHARVIADVYMRPGDPLVAVEKREQTRGGAEALKKARGLSGEGVQKRRNHPLVAL